MSNLNVLSREGAITILRRLSTGEARFKELNEVVTNTRTLTRRLEELQAEGLIEKAESCYRMTDEGFDIAFKLTDMKWKIKPESIYHESFTKIRYTWMEISLKRLLKLFLKGFGKELISIILYGSAIKDTFKLGRSDVDLLYILENGAKNTWWREEKVFKHFQSTWEYKSCDYWLKTRGFNGYPEVTTASLQRSYAKIFQPIYLDMLKHRAVLYDKEGFFEKLMEKLRGALEALGSIYIEHADGTYCWFLKPDITPGESIKISLE
ncbi:MAG: hypothetical protein AOA66_0856 [Candidatus Bathyarchaeota archaeon BA2]|nr:MAG: hypothetical protein AOA66_0856 [Candidatus Bathyarchaeota archaeon BA2]